MVRGGFRKGSGRPSGTGKFGKKTKSIRVPFDMVEKIFEFINVEDAFKIPLYSNSVSAGFPSPAEDDIEGKLDLNELLISNASATFFVKASGDSMIGASIQSGDILVVDRSIEPKIGKIVIAAVAGNLTVKRLVKIDNEIYLSPENPKYKPIKLNAEEENIIWGVVTNVIHKVE